MARALPHAYMDCRAANATRIDGSGLAAQAAVTGVTSRRSML